jgi:hypothetical protein
MILRRRVLAACLPLMTIGALVPAPTALAAAPLTFNVLIGGCIAGSVPIQATNVGVVWRDAAGHLKARFTVPTTNDATWFAPHSVCKNRVAVPGDRLRAHVTQPSSMTRGFTIPTMRGSFARGSWITSGVAPRSGSFLVASWAQYLSRPRFYSRAVVHPGRDAEGRWAFDQSEAVGGWTPRGGDRADAVWTSPGGDTVTLRMRAPYLEAEVGLARVFGYTSPFRAVSLVLHASNGTLRGSGKASTTGTGAFSITFRRAGQPVTVNAGDRITGDWAAGATYTVPGIVLQYNLPQNTVDADCQRWSFVGAWGTWENAQHPFFDGETNPHGVAVGMDAIGTNHQLAVGDGVDVRCGNRNGDRTHIATVITSDPD